MSESGLQTEPSQEADERLERLRASYELYAVAIARQLALELPDWLPEGIEHNWRAAARAGRRRRGGLLP